MGDLYRHRRLLAATAALAWLATLAGLDALCLCGTCPRSEALLGASREPAAHACCRTAAAAAGAARAADIDAYGGVSAPDCCEGPAAAVVAAVPPACDPIAPAVWTLAAALAPWPQSVAAGAAPVASWPPAAARPPPLPRAVFLHTLRIRV